MPSRMPELEAIKILLWEEWDPIGVKDHLQAFGEYDSYAGQVYSKLIRGADAEEIARYLSWVVTTHIGLGADDQHSMAIAEKAVAIHLDHKRI
jgi:hypothetical protein